MIVQAMSDVQASTDKDGYVGANVADVLQVLQGRGFTKDGEMPRKVSGPFRHLTWRDLAVEHLVAPVELNPPPEVAAEDHEPDMVYGTDAEGVAELPDAAGVDTHAASPNDDPRSDIGDSSHTVPDIPVPVEPPALAVDEQVLQKIRDDAYAEGLSAGKAMTESEREAELAQQFDRLRDLIERLDATDLLDIVTLSASLKRAVLDLASQRVGLLLTEMPDILAERIETLVQNLSHLSGQRELFLAPEDVPLVQGSFVERQHYAQLHIIADSSLRRGDARLRIGGAEMSDLMGEMEKPAVKPEAEPV